MPDVWTMARLRYGIGGGVLITSSQGYMLSIWLKILYYYYYYYYFCCPGSLLCGGALHCSYGLFSSCSMQAFQLWYTGLAACLPFHLSPHPQPAPSMWDHGLQTKDWTCVPCIEKQILNQWPIREVPDCSSLSRLTLITWLQVSLSDFSAVKFSILHSLEGHHYMQLTSDDWRTMPHLLKGR